MVDTVAHQLPSQALMKRLGIHWWIGSVSLGYGALREVDIDSVVDQLTCTGMMLFGTDLVFFKVAKSRPKSCEFLRQGRKGKKMRENEQDCTKHSLELKQCELKTYIGIFGPILKHPIQCTKSNTSLQKHLKPVAFGLVFLLLCIGM